MWCVQCDAVLGLDNRGAVVLGYGFGVVGHTARTSEARVGQGGTDQHSSRGSDSSPQAATGSSSRSVKHVLIACEEQSSRTTRDQSAGVRARVPRSFDARNARVGLLDRQAAPAARVHRRRDRTSGTLPRATPPARRWLRGAPSMPVAWSNPRLGHRRGTTPSSPSESPARVAARWRKRSCARCRLPRTAVACVPTCRCVLS